MLSKLKNRTVHMARTATLMLASLGLGMAWTGAALTATSATFLAAGPAMAADQERTNRDVVIFRTGQEVQGEIIEETPTTIRMRVMVAGIAAETTYSKSDILSVMRGEGEPVAKPAAETATSTRAMTATAAATPGGPDRKKIYVLPLTGIFGEEISQTPIREAVLEAQRQEVDYIIVELDNDWSLRRTHGLDIDLPEDERERYLHHMLNRAADMEIIFREEIPRHWDNPPTIVFWIKNAMSGAAILPLSSPNIYFHSEGRMGGVGHLNHLLGGVGDEVVRQKMYSALTAQAIGLAIAGGYDPRIVRAMTWTDYVLSVRFVGGRPVFTEGYPSEPGDVLLTDDGKDDREDTIEQLARGEGNDVLTLRADMAYKLGLSKGTADTLEDLIFLLGLARNHEVVRNRADHIMRQWRREVDDGKRNLRRLWEEYGEIQVGGDMREQRRAIGRRMNIINQMKGLIRRLEEAFHPYSIGVPHITDLDIMEEQLRQQLMGLRR
jgi:hypothetical protein